MQAYCTCRKIAKDYLKLLRIHAFNKSCPYYWTDACATYNVPLCGIFWCNLMMVCIFPGKNVLWSYSIIVHLGNTYQITYCVHSVLCTCVPCNEFTGPYLGLECVLQSKDGMS